jgi:hypothetical protein
MFTKSARFYDAIYSWKDYEDEARKVVALISARNPAARTLLDVGMPGGIDSFTERHEVSLFTRRQYDQAFEAAGLHHELDQEGLMGRGVYVAVRDRRI